MGLVAAASFAALAAAFLFVGGGIRRPELKRNTRRSEGTRTRDGEMRKATHGQVVSEQLHDESRVLVGVLVQSVQLGDGVVEGLQEEIIVVEHARTLSTAREQTAHTEG